VVSATEHEQLAPIATIPDVVEALRLLGVGVGVDESVPGVKVGLAYSAVGAAERNALATEQHARANGAGPAEFRRAGRRGPRRCGMPQRSGGHRAAGMAHHPHNPSAAAARPLPGAPVLIAASCGSRRLTVAVAVAVDAGTRVLDDTGAPALRPLTLRNGAGLLTLPSRSPLRSLTIIRRKRTTRLRVDAPPAERQCGWTAALLG
jgi:hypothetical protein